MTWRYVGAEIMACQCLEEAKKLLSASPFSLYNRLT
jgi:hypothetical protein